MIQSLSKPSSYETHSSIQKDLIRWGVPYIGKNLNNKSILELGAGTGLLTQELIKMHPKTLLATDIDINRILFAQKKGMKAEWDLINAWNPPLGEKYDALFSSSLLHWSPNPAQTLSKWKLLLTYGGEIHALLFIDKTLNELRQCGDHLSPVNWRSSKDWVKSFENAGLNVTSIKTERRKYNFQSALQLFQFLHKTGVTQKNKVDLKNLKKIIRDYNERFLLGNGVYSTWEFCYIRAYI